MLYVRIAVYQVSMFSCPLECHFSQAPSTSQQSKQSRNVSRSSFLGLRVPYRCSPMGALGVDGVVGVRRVRWTLAFSLDWSFSYSLHALGCVILNLCPNVEIVCTPNIFVCTFNEMMTVSPVCKPQLGHADVSHYFQRHLWPSFDCGLLSGRRAL